MGKIILDKMAMQRALTRITYEIVEKNKGVEDLVLIGIKTRGIFFSKSDCRSAPTIGKCLDSRWRVGYY